MRRVPALVISLALLLTACGSDDAATDGASVSLRVSTAEGDVTLRVEVADTPDERSEGLSNRTSLAEDAGMAFVWEEPVQARFWMKDTLIPLQIAFWGEDGVIVAMYEMTPCEAEPCETYGPDEPFVGAVEANTGWFTDHGVEVGDSVTLDA